MEKTSEEITKLKEIAKDDIKFRLHIMQVLEDIQEKLSELEGDVDSIRVDVEGIKNHLDK